MMTTPIEIEGDWAQDGYLIVRNLFDAPRVAALLAVSESCMHQWKECSPETGEPGTADPDNARSMRHLNHPGYFPAGADDPGFVTLMEAVADPKVLRLATMCMPDEVCGGPLFRSTTLFFNPEGDPATNNREGDWHSDAQFVIPDEADEKQFLEEEAASGIGQYSAGIQMQVALVANEDVQLVPGSHLRWDTPEEYTVRCADGRKHSKSEMPNSLRCVLQPGDCAMFNSWGFHRGRYHVDRPRRTLMFTFTPCCMPSWDYFSDQPWFLNPGHLASLSPAAQEFFGQFVQAFETKWRARGSTEASTQIDQATASKTRDRSSKNYVYPPALNQFHEFRQQMGVDSSLLGRLAKL